MKQELFHTNNLKIATALLTMGFEKIGWTRQVQCNGKEATVFWFAASNKEGVKAVQVMKGMQEGISDDLEHPVNYMRCFALNRDTLIGDVHATPRMVTVERDGRTMAIPEDASEETKRKLSEIF